MADESRISRAPAYQRVENDIRSRIEAGILAPGSMLASRHNLAREYGVALSTAQQAISNLIAEGILETVDRKGTFVALKGNDVHTRSLRDTPGEMVEHSNGEAPTMGELPPLTELRLGIVSTALIDPATSADVGSTWARLAIRALEQAFSAAGGSTHFFDRYPESLGPYVRGFDDGNAIPMPVAISKLKTMGVSAIAVVGLCDSRDMSDEVMGAVDINQVPVVYLSWHEIPPPLAQVYYDNRYAGYQAAHHLVRNGYSRLVMLRPFEEQWLDERIEGARSAVRHAGHPHMQLQLFPDAIDNSPYLVRATTGSVKAMVPELLSQLTNDPESSKMGIIAPNDDTAYAVIEAAAEVGLTVGKDFGLVGFDDDARSCTLGLTTVRPPVEEMGEEAGRLLLRALRGDKQGLQVRLRSHLIPRASTFNKPAAHSAVEK